MCKQVITKKKKIRQYLVDHHLPYYCTKRRLSLSLSGFFSLIGGLRDGRRAQDYQVNHLIVSTVLTGYNCDWHDIGLKHTSLVVGDAVDSMRFLTIPETQTERLQASIMTMLRLSWDSIQAG